MQVPFSSSDYPFVVAFKSDTKNNTDAYGVHRSCVGFDLSAPQREVTRIRMAQTLRGDLTSQQEADLMDLLAEKVGEGAF